MIACYAYKINFIDFSDYNIWNLNVLHEIWTIEDF